ncbi:hypothetical protein EB796_005195 [Bugula neritina]|uniref:Uncharacterized protein n=1 Tax=Bugula neritina TaxID=10212 RepID=A0A7J7KEY5_BUGNE|nr:hypothetical protein EB796_011871 [Bugula neritina]KAF6036494.1 hypothetical protein EB796_005195 [Bugula neritina]
MQELKQIINYDRTISLPYLNYTTIHVRFCPSQLTGKKFGVTSILQADDSRGKSIIAQAVCTTKECTFDTPEPDRVGDNFNDLPVNVATTKPDSYTDLYIYAVAFDGEWQSNTTAPIGKFRFGATTQT